MMSARAIPHKSSGQPMLPALRTPMRRRSQPMHAQRGSGGWVVGALLMVCSALVVSVPLVHAAASSSNQGVPGLLAQIEYLNAQIAMLQGQVTTQQGRLPTSTLCLPTRPARLQGYKGWWRRSMPLSLIHI